MAAAARPFPAPRPSRFYIPELDALRFLAFFAVFAHHVLWAYGTLHGFGSLAFRTIAQSGAFGVDFFFCLSAYLITSLLLRERETTGAIDVPAFYKRRILRIWPLYFAFLAALVLLQIALGRMIFSWPHVVLAVFLCANLLMAGKATSLAIIPLWSLSVEEQFYALWPWAMRHASRAQLVGIACGVWLFSIGARALMALHGVFGAEVWFTTVTRLDPIAAGILLAVLPESATTFIDGRRRRLCLTGISAIALASLLAAIDGDHAGLPMLFGYPLAAGGCAAILSAAIGCEAKLLLWRPLRELGERSYGLYVIHGSMIALALWLFAGADSIPRWLLIATCALSATILLAAASYRWLEMPFNHLRRRYQHVASH